LQQPEAAPIVETQRQGLADQRLGGHQPRFEPVSDLERLDGVARGGRFRLVGMRRGRNQND
jgi:hypothetical protein